MDQFSLIIQSIAIFGLLIFSGLFSMSETAITGASQAKIYQLQRKKRKGAKRLSILLDKREKVVASLLLGNTLVNILVSSLTTNVFLQLFGAAGIAYATTILTFIIVIFCEILPKTYAIRHSEITALFLTAFISLAYLILAPFSLAAQWIAEHVIRRMYNEDGKNQLLSAQDELRGAVDLLHKQGNVVKAEKDMLGGLLDLKELTVSDIMIHRTNMVSINIDLPIDDIVRDSLGSPYTRIPLWRKEPENIIGLLHVKTLVRSIVEHNQNLGELDITQIAAKPWFIPDSTMLADQLKSFLREKTHFAFVVDEYGEVMGHITLEDILEEIVGEISDEHDEVAKGVTKEKSGSIISNGHVPIRELNRAFDWDLPDEEATTIAGLVIHEAQMIPLIGQSFTFYGFKFEILQREANKVTSLRITPPKK